MPDLLLLLIVIGVGLALFALAYVVSRPRRRTTPVRPRHPGPPPHREEEPPEDDGGVATLDVPEMVEPETAIRPPDGAVELPTAAPAAPPVEELTLGERFRRRLVRTRNVLGAGVLDLFGRGVSDEAWEGLEETLVAADVGVDTALALVEQVRTRTREEGVTSAGGVVELLKAELRGLLGAATVDLRRSGDDTPSVWLVAGVNGTGKTTSIGKLAAHEQREGRTVVLGAADTFRAAAIDQLGIWAERAGARLVKQEPGADPAAVAYDAYNAGRAVDADVVIVDTAGRLHNKKALMDELGKVKRVLEKQAGPLEEVLLVIDATTGQNGVAQARVFLEAVDVTGIVLTKLDGTSRGGIVVAVQRELGIPVKLVGLGEGIDDLAPFDADAFVDALFEGHAAAA
ncbi:MAG TPA: signal recognition particle-docking protein FtsY [Nitriliruptorales bacterium]|nr:signal recognition particle-docking protein FtsY [Nitriliruptorales bacterium]